nr:transglutaminase-like cysteine peptidase [Mesorhizobium loti]
MRNLAVSTVMVATPSAYAATGPAMLEARDSAVKPVQMAEFLGGVSLSKPSAAVASNVYRTVIGSAYSLAMQDFTEKRDFADRKPELDPIQTAAIIPGVFGSMAISMKNFPAATRWASVYRSVRNCDKICDQTSSGYAFIIKAVKDKSFTDKLTFVNSGVNQLIAYRKDEATYGKLDYWATPEETLTRRSGDCEDFAILKMAALLEAGVPATSMSLVVLQDKKRNVFHAVLSVSTSTGTFILDSLSNKVVMDSALPNYVPLYSFSTERAWVHGAKTGESRVASLKGGLSDIAPGEGPEN